MPTVGQLYVVLKSRPNERIKDSVVRGRSIQWARVKRVALVGEPGRKFRRQLPALKRV